MIFNGSSFVISETAIVFVASKSPRLVSDLDSESQSAPSDLRHPTHEAELWLQGVRLVEADLSPMRDSTG